MIGEKSNPPIGGIIFLKGPKKASDTIANALKKGTDQSIDGIQVKNILRIITQKYS